MKRFILACAAGALLVSCGPGEELGEGDAQVAWGATNKALTAGQPASGGPADSFGGSNSYDCPDGGTAKFNASVKLGDAFDTTNVNVTYTVDFQKCVVDGVKIIGELDYGVSVQTDATSSYTEWSYNGDLIYKGDVSGTCLIDMSGSAGASAAGASVTYEGSICGNDASVTLNTGS